MLLLLKDVPFSWPEFVTLQKYIFDSSQLYTLLLVKMVVILFLQFVFNYKIRHFSSSPGTFQLLDQNVYKA